MLHKNVIENKGGFRALDEAELEAVSGGKGIFSQDEEPIPGGGDDDDEDDAGTSGGIIVNGTIDFWDLGDIGSIGNGGVVGTGGGSTSGGGSTYGPQEDDNSGDEDDDEHRITDDIPEPEVPNTIFDDIVDDVRDVVETGTIGDETFIGTDVNDGVFVGVGTGTGGASIGVIVDWP